MVFQPNHQSSLPTIFPEHAADLEKSNISVQFVLSQGVFSADRVGIASILGKQPHPDVKSALVFDYGRDFYRMKVFPSYKGFDGTVRYLQRKGSGSRFYIPLAMKDIVATPKSPFRIAEGEKKCLAACERGIPTIAIAGLWNWRENRRPMEDLDKIDWADRMVTLVPDSDVWAPGKEDLLVPVYSLGLELTFRGADVEYVILPLGIVI